MCDLSNKATFLSIAFQPTSDDVKRATRRKYPGPSRSQQPFRSTSQVINIDDDSSSDEDMPDISTILKNSNAAKNGAKAKGRKVLDSDDEMEDDKVRALSREYRTCTLTST